MPTPYEQLCISRNAASRSPYMRLPSYQTLRRQRYHPYRTTRTKSSLIVMDVMELDEEADFEDMLLAHVHAMPSFSLPTNPEDDWMSGLRTVVSQMIGRDSAQMRLGFVHLVIDFALIVRSHLRQRRLTARYEAATTLPAATIGPSM